MRSESQSEREREMLNAFAFFILHCSKRLIVTYLCIYIPVDKLIRFVMVKIERVKRVTIWKPMKIKRTSENEIAQMKKSTL